uniref:Immunoglobulin domain-containing protein n=1 Tax=Sinocyclocheilus grahami TaxID=75366 RepID=A0A672L8J7_SINGR
FRYLFVLICVKSVCSAGVFGESVSVMEGDSVTLHTDLTEIHEDDDILWTFGAENSPIAKINRAAGIFNTSDVPDGRFRDRLKLDDQTGSLTITDITSEHAGLYKLQIRGAILSSQTSNVSVYGQFIHTHTHTHIQTHTCNCSFVSAGVFGDTDEVKSVMEGDLVALNTDVIKQKEDDIIQWYFNNALIAMINGHPNTSCNYDGEGGRFIDRLKVDYKTGSLTITDITTEHAGRYEAELITSQSSGTIKKLNIPSKCDHTKITPKSSTHDKIIKSFSLTVSGESFNVIYPEIITFSFWTV